ncbi:MAG: hypothetical protein KBH06_06730 [Spirochaetes bacterium]|nr:hypothetical protein [Spirochaetota bacterium]
MKCSICNQIFNLTPWQKKFIDESKSKNMSFIMLECRKCFTHFPFNPLENQNILTKRALESKPPIEKVLLDLKKKNYLLPDDYLKVISSFNEPRTVKCKNAEYRIYSTIDLMLKINIDGGDYFQINEIRAHTKNVKSFFKRNYVEDTEKNIVKINSLNKYLCIGNADGDLLLINPEDNYSLWLFCHDGAYLEKIDDNLNGLMNLLKISDNLS